MCRSVKKNAKILQFTSQVWKFHSYLQGLKYSGTVPDFQHAALKKKNCPILKKTSCRLDITSEFMSSSANDMTGTQISLSQINIFRSRMGRVLKKCTSTNSYAA